MKKLFGKSISVFLVFAMLFMTAQYAPSLTVRAERPVSGECGDSITWVLNDEGTLTLSGTGDMYDYSNVNSGSISPFYYDKRIKKLVIGEGITSIGDCMFYWCDEMTEAVIPEGVTDIGFRAFTECTTLKKADLPNSLEKIGDWAFEDCFELEGVNLSKNLMSIGWGAFSECYSFTHAEAPDGTTELNGSMFSCNFKLTDLKIPDTIRVVNSMALSFCEGLETFTLPDGAEEIWYNAFWECCNLKSITLPNTIKFIKESAFEDCDALEDVYYIGTREEWDCIDIEIKNECLTEANIHFMPKPAEIVRIAGFTRYDTAVEISKAGWTKAETAIIANGGNYADALVGVPLAYKLDAPILLTANAGKLENKVEAQLESLGVKNIVILGGPSAVSLSISNALEEKYDVKRIAGFNRYQTALEIAKNVSENPQTAVVVTGEGYADALSISSYAAMKGYPIVYTSPVSGLTSGTLAYLAETENVIIVGGPGVIGTKTPVQLSGKSLDTIAGYSRYQTSCEVAKRFSSEFGKDVMLATGNSFPDALAGGVLAAKLGTSLLLADKPSVISVSKEFIAERHPRKVYVLGNTGVISDSMIEDIFA